MDGREVAVRMITVAVDMADILALTLPYNRHHFKEVCVVTSSRDEEAWKVAAKNNTLVYITDVFYENGAHFNKWAALEEGLDFMGREGWIAVMDVDTVLPKAIPTVLGGKLTLTEWLFGYGFIGQLYTPRRRMLEDLSSLRNGLPDER